MQSSLVPERPLVISPTLAATIGLDEAVMLHVLSELMAHRPLREKNRLRWIALDNADLCKAFPFWAFIDIKRVQNSLQELGLILLEPDDSRSDSCWYAINQIKDSEELAPRGGGEQVSTVAKPAMPPKIQPAAALDPSSVGPQGASYIAPGWQPEEAWLQHCRQHNIPDEFTLGLVPGFVSYWRDRRQARFSWGNAFYKHVLREWRQEQNRRGMSELETAMSADWWPSDDALGILERSGINASFVEDAVPEFVLYWRERGVNNGAWNTRFIEHVRRQWSKFTATMGHDTQPRRIEADWQPDSSCFDVLRLAEIDEDFARSKVSEFVLYWRDTNQAQASWNTRFLQYIKFQWARRLTSARQWGQTDAYDQSASGKNPQGLAAAYQRLTDRSWAE